MLVTVLSAFMLLTVYQTWEAYRSYRFSSINYPDDYTFGRLMGHIGSEDTMTEEQFNKRGIWSWKSRVSCNIF